MLALSEVAGLLGKPYAPVLPPWGTGIAAAMLRRVGVRIPPEAMNQLRYGRGVDNRRYKATGFHYQHTSREAVLKLGEHMRLHPVVRGAQERYRYEREVEEFLRWSPHVRRSGSGQASALSRGQIAELQRPAGERRGRMGTAARARRIGSSRPRSAPASAEQAAAKATERAKKAERRAAEAALKATERAKKAERRARQAAEDAVERASRVAQAPAQPEPAPSRPVDHYDELAAEEVIALLASLERDDLGSLRDYEREHANRARVISAIDSVLARG